MFDGSIPCWIPRIPIGDTARFRVSVTPYGDGYKQRLLDGINAVEQSWAVVWEHREEPDIWAMDAYLRNKGDDGIPFMHPVTQVLYIIFCENWSIEWNLLHGEIRYGTMSALFTRANGVTLVYTT
jgi:phage-related protein